VGYPANLVGVERGNVTAPNDSITDDELLAALLAEAMVVAESGDFMSTCVCGLTFCRLLSPREAKLVEGHLRKVYGLKEGT
jgi:hypothetical protein